MSLGVVKGFLAEVRPLPMSLMLLTCLLGGFFAAGPFIKWDLIGLVLLNAFCFLYVAHLNDTFFDIRKGEYESERKLHSVRLNDKAYLPRWGFGYEIPNAPILPKNNYLAAMSFFIALGLLIMSYLSFTVLGWMYVALAVVGLTLALTYSAGLDKMPAFGDTMWEVGVLFTLFCGYYSQKLVLDLFIIQTGIVLFIALIGVKALDSLPDTAVDDKINKRTLTVFLYRKGLSLKNIRHICYLPIYIALVVLYTQVPMKLGIGVILTAVFVLTGHLALFKDEKGRLSIIAAGFSLIFFILYAICFIAGLLGA